MNKDIINLKCGCQIETITEDRNTKLSIKSLCDKHQNTDISVIDLIRQ